MPIHNFDTIEDEPNKTSHRLFFKSIRMTNFRPFTLHALPTFTGGQVLCGQGFGRHNIELNSFYMFLIENMK